MAVIMHRTLKYLYEDADIAGGVIPGKYRTTVSSDFELIETITPNGVSHASDCPHRGERRARARLYADCDKWCRRETLITLFEGAVLCTREYNGYHDSDFYVIAWDKRNKRLRRYEYATTRFGGGGSASVDATDEVKDAAAAWLADQIFDRLKYENEADSRKVEPGKRVVVVKGRKVPKGTVGEVVWYQSAKEARYGRARVRILTDEGDEHYTDARNCEVEDPSKHILPDAELRAKAEHLAQRVRERNYGWHTLFVPSGVVSL
jgi:hypothetical protein